MGKRVTIKDIAKEAGVSIATVSYYMNGHYENMSEEVRLRVEDIVRKMDYHPSNIARNLKLNRSKTIGIIINGFHGQIGFLMIKGAYSCLAEAGYDTTIFVTGDMPWKEREYIQHCIENQVNGIIITASGAEVASEFTYLKKVVQNGPRIVVANRYTECWPYDGVMIDYAAATREMVIHLAQQGFTKVAFLIDSDAYSSLSIGKRIRCDTFVETSMHCFADTEIPPIYYNVKSENAAVEAVTDFVKRYPNEQKAVFAANSPVLTLALKAIREKKMTIPHEIGLCGFGGWDWSSLINPSITVMTQPLDEVGRIAAEHLVEQIEGKRTKFEPTFIKAELVRGESTQLKNDDLT